MKKIIILVCVFLSITAYAAEETKQQKLTELVDIMNMDSMIDSMYSQMGGIMENMAVQMDLKPSERPIFDKYNQRMIAIMKENMSWKHMEPMVLDIYNRNFSEQEITDMLKFYKTETGKAILVKMPIVIQESMQLSQSLVQPLFPKLQEIGEQLGEELAKAREVEQQKTLEEKKDTTKK